MPKFEHNETITIHKRPRKKRKKGKSAVSAKVRKHHGRTSRVIKPNQSEATKQIMDTDLEALAEVSFISVDALKSIKKESPGLFITLTNAYRHKLKPTLQ